MMSLIAQGGPMMWPLVFVAVLVLALTVWVLLRLPAVEGPDPVLETGIDATLFWGGWAVMLGLLGTFIGIYQAAGAIERATTLSANIIWGGIRVALTTTLFGLIIFVVAALLWFGLRTWYRRVAV